MDEIFIADPIKSVPQLDIYPAFCKVKLQSIIRHTPAAA
jgi:hypothetical protein